MGSNQAGMELISNTVLESEQASTSYAAAIHIQVSTSIMEAACANSLARITSAGLM